MLCSAERAYRCSSESGRASLEQTNKLVDGHSLGNALLDLLTSWIPQLIGVTETTSRLREVLASPPPECNRSAAAANALQAIQSVMEATPVVGQGLLAMHIYISDQAFGSFFALDVVIDDRRAVFFVAHRPSNDQIKLGPNRKCRSACVECLHRSRHLIANRAVERRLSQPSSSSVSEMLKNDPGALDVDATFSVISTEMEVRTLCESAA